MTLPHRIARLFHNYRTDAIDMETNADWIVLTVLRDGDWDDHRWLFAQYGWDRVAAVVRRDLDGLQTLPHVVTNFWSIVFWGRPLPYPSLRDRWRPTRRIPQP